jgi:bifunctional non-homologous end joining protein LigD
MLAHVGHQRGKISADEFAAKYSPSEWALEPKVDGHRRVVVKRGTKVVSYSRPRAGAAAATVALDAHLEAAARFLPDGIYDGEYAVPGPKSRSWHAGTDGLPKILVLFDILEVLGQRVMGRSYDDRRQLLQAAVALVPKNAGIEMTPQLDVTLAAIEQVWAAGGEGGMLKRRTGTYRPGYRSADWVKVKNIEQHVCTIIGFKQGSFGPHSTLLLQMPDGTKCAAKTRNNEWLKMFAQDAESFIGRRVVIECQERTEGGSPRSPMVKQFVMDHMAAETE